MSKSEIATRLFGMKKSVSSLVTIEGTLYSADELLGMYLGRPVKECEAQQFIVHDLDHAYTKV